MGGTNNFAHQTNKHNPHEKIAITGFSEIFFILPRSRWLFCISRPFFIKYNPICSVACQKINDRFSSDKTSHLRTALTIAKDNIEQPDLKFHLCVPTSHSPTIAANWSARSTPCMDFPYSPSSLGRCSLGGAYFAYFALCSTK